MHSLWGFSFDILWWAFTFVFSEYIIPIFLTQKYWDPAYLHFPKSLIGIVGWYHNVQRISCMIMFSKKKFLIEIPELMIFIYESQS